MKEGSHGFEGNRGGGEKQSLLTEYKGGGL